MPPSAPKRSGPDTGDGDWCPVDESHGRMFVANETQTQWCPRQEHDGVWPKEGPRTPPTRSRWPLGRDSFRVAVDTWRKLVDHAAESALPDIDLGELNA